MLHAFEDSLLPVRFVHDSCARRNSIFDVIDVDDVFLNELDDDVMWFDFDCCQCDLYFRDSSCFRRNA